MSRYKSSQPTCASPRNIVVFGEAGVGKSSLINLVAGRSVAATSNDLDPSRHARHRVHQELLDGTPYFLWDTVGLNQGEKGTEKSLELLLADLSRANGVHLLVYCVRASSFHGPLLKNYNIFYSAICRKKVPVVVVVTGLEYEEKMERWWTNNKAWFADRKMHFDGHACITTLSAGEVALSDDSDLKQRYDISREVIRTLITTTSTPYPGLETGHKDWVSAAIADVRAMLKPQHSSSQPEPIIALCNLPNPTINTTVPITDTLPFEGGHHLDVRGSPFLVYHIRGQHLHAGTQFKKQIALRGADLLIICASVHSDPGTCQQIAASFYRSYGGDTRPLLIVVRDALSEAQAHEWWNTVRTDVGFYHKGLQAIVHALPPVERSDARAAAVTNIQQTIQMRSLQSVGIPTGFFDRPFGKRCSPKSYPASTAGAISSTLDECLIDCNVW